MINPPTGPRSRSRQSTDSLRPRIGCSGSQWWWGQSRRRRRVWYTGCEIWKPRTSLPFAHPPKLNPALQPFYTAEEIRSFRTLGLEPGQSVFSTLSDLYLPHSPFQASNSLGSKTAPSWPLRTISNTPSLFILTRWSVLLTRVRMLDLTPLKSYSGSKRTFSALLKSMIKKEKIGLALALTRRNASPIFCYLLPQVSILIFTAEFI